MHQRDIADLYPLSPMQQGMVFHTLYTPEAAPYFVQWVCTIEGQLDVPCFQQAWRRVVEQHPILRTVFLWEGLERPLQAVLWHVELPWEQQDWRGLQHAEQQACLERYLLADRQRPFVLSQPPLMRFGLLQLAERRYQLVWSFHHALLDGWSLSLVLEDLVSAYAALRNGQEVLLPQRRPYRDFIAYLTDQDPAGAEHFWRELLAGFQAPTPLGLEHLAPAPEDAPSATDELCPLAEPLAAALPGFLRTHQLTLNTLMQGAWAVLLSRYSGEEDVVFGGIVSGRSLAQLGFDALVGILVNTLPVRVRVAPGRPVLDWLHGLQEQQLAAREYEHTPLVAIQGWSPVGHRLPLFESVLNIENYPLGSVLSGQQAHDFVFSDAYVVERTNYPLNISVLPGARPTLKCIYDPRRFDVATIRRLFAHLQALLEQIIADPQRLVGALDPLPAAERQLLLADWNATAAPFPDDTCFHHLFEAQVRRAPDASAAQDQRQWLTYAELNQRANQLAHYLRHLGVGPEARVGICMERSVELIVCILGVLKAGGAYVPLDPDYPRERLAFMLQDSGPLVLLTQQALAGRLPPHSAQVVLLDQQWPAIASQSSADPAVAVTARNLAYIIYTSGSTGRPKGVLLEHRGLCNVSEAQCQTFDARCGDRVLQFSSLNFDASIFEIIMALRVGATLVLASRQALMPGPDLAQLLAEQRITHLTIPPSSLAAVPFQPLPHLRTLLVAGEPCPTELVNRWAPGRRFFNAYGPTETTIWATVTACTPGEQAPSIGRPIANTEIYILDRAQQPVPVGVPGEIYIGGVGLARGYLNREELTRERFIAHPFDSTGGARLYRTGDLARYLPDGNIEFLGRIDQQVKLRGFRIELGEIEAQLLKLPGVQEAVVLLREDRPGDQRLVAYFVPAPGHMPESADLRSALKEQLPEHMLPGAFVPIEAIPLNPNGKFDRAALPAPGHVRQSVPGSGTLPRTPVEALLATIWSEVLGSELSDTQVSFFELGGHSLLATRLINRVREAFQIDVPLRLLFEVPTIAGFAEAIDRLRDNPGSGMLDGQQPDLLREARLDPAIQPQPDHDVRLSQSSHSFISGATGFLGAFLLSSLLQQTQGQIYCLVRATAEAEGLQRIRASLERYLLWQAEWEQRIIPVAGDLDQAGLGLSAALFDELAAQVDAIYHCGARVGFIYPYSALRPSNVLGTQEMLRLACHGKPKQLHYLSTLSVLGHAEGDQGALLGEDYQLNGHPPTQSGYVQSKWVAEHLIAEACSRGLPVAIYRPGRVSGHSQSGASNENDFISRLMKGCIQLGYAPDLPMVENLAPVDYVASAIAYLARQRGSIGKVFHLLNPQPLTLAQLLDGVASFGYQLERIAFDRWRSIVLEQVRDDTSNALYPLLSFFSEITSAEQWLEKLALPDFDGSKTSAALAGSEIACPPIDQQLLSRYLRYFVNSGFLPAPQLITSHDR